MGRKFSPQRTFISSVMRQKIRRTHTVTTGIDGRGRTVLSTQLV